MAYYGNISDYGWVAFYDYFDRIGILNHDKFSRFKDFLLSGVFETIQLSGVCIACELPIKLTRDDNGRLHNESGSAIEWSDTYGQYYWHGVNVPSKLINTPDLITKDDIIKESNAEVRRAYREKLGNELFAMLLGIEAIDVDFLNGQEYTLYKTKDKDEHISDFIYWIKVKCTSTAREYFICVPPMKKALEALAWTFNKIPDEYKPVIET